MKVRGNDDFLRYLAIRKELREQFSEQTEMINLIYFSLRKDSKEILKKHLYSFGYSLVTIIFLIILTLSKTIYPEQFGLLLSIIPFILMIIFIIMVIKAYNEKQKINQEWNSKIEEVNKLKDAAYEYTKKAADEVPSIICFTENYDEILKFKENNYSNEIFNQYWAKKIDDYNKIIKTQLKEDATADDIIEYYNNWGKQITQSEYEDYQYFRLQRLHRFKVETNKK